MKMRENCPISPLNAEDIPSTASAVREYESRGGVLSREKDYGYDPLRGTIQASHREQLFLQRFTFEAIFHALVNEDDSLFKDAIITFIDITCRLSSN